MILLCSKCLENLKEPQILFLIFCSRIVILKIWSQRCTKPSFFLQVCNVVARRLAKYALAVNSAIMWNEGPPVVIQNASSTASLVFEFIQFNRIVCNKRKYSKGSKCKKKNHEDESESTSELQGLVLQFSQKKM